MINKVCTDWMKERTYQHEMSNASMALMEEAQCEVTKDGDVTKTGKGEKSQEIHANNSWMTGIITLTSFLFAFLTGRLICLYADEDEPSDKLSASQMEKEFKFSIKSKNVLEERKDLLETECWKTWVKGLFKMRTLPRFTLWISAEMLQKNNREGVHGQEPMKSFKLGSLMQQHRLMEMKSSMTSSKSNG